MNTATQNADWHRRLTDFPETIQATTVPSFVDLRQGWILPFTEKYGNTF
jgi:hypothetical protein